MDRIDKWNKEVRCQSDVIHNFVPECGGKAKHVSGKTYEISNPPAIGAVHLHDNCRTMPKQERELLRFWLYCLGFFSVIAVLAAPLWLPIVMGGA